MSRNKNRTRKPVCLDEFAWLKKYNSESFVFNSVLRIMFEN